MKPFSALPLILMAGLLSFYSCQKKNPIKIDRTDFETNDDSTTKAWTYLFYDNADFEQAYDPMYDFVHFAFSGQQINTLILRDRENRPAAYYRVTEDHTAEMLKELGEVNMGDAQTLADFLQFSKELYPAKRTILAFYGHGNGWGGCCNDDTDNDYLSMDDIQNALMQVGGVDVVLFTAPCLMGSVEAVYELRDCCDLYVGSEDLSGFVYWYPILSNLFSLLKNSPNIDIYSLGHCLVDLIKQSDLDPSDYQWLCMSALRTDRIVALKTAIDEVSLTGIENNPTLSSLMGSNSHDPFFFSTQHADLISLMETWSENDSTIIPLTKTVQKALDSCIVASCFGVNNQQARGLNIYFPNAQTSSYRTVYGDTEYGLDFSADTHWDDLLRLLWGTAKALPGPASSGGWPPLREDFHRR